MSKIGIISGGGKLPVLIGRNLLKKNYDVTFFVIKDTFNKKIYSNLKTIEIELNSIKKIFNILEENKINKIILAGNIARPSLKDVNFDFETIKFAKKLLLNKKGDNELLIAITKLFQDKGFQYLDWKDYCPELFSNNNKLTIKIPSTEANLNLSKGLKIFKNYGNLDIGQSLIVQNEIVLGLEAAEGTDKLIIRCHELKKKGDKGILIKASKYNQSNILDIPTIGAQTLQLLINNDYEGVFIEKNNCLIIDKDETISLANSANLFISTFEKN
ncbi:UDP-2,3-diacylglucosamine diphosphatase LpxI [Pelagibacterales bacterium SAG-MED31]|nr:UDP-2,3-diacylglucosamine diphosphatase LpxI [Pelagibacterales bacterium SAG-MED31]